MQVSGTGPTERASVSRLWCVCYTLLVVGCNLGLPSPDRPATASVPEDVLARAEAGMTETAMEFPGNMVPSNRAIGDPSDVVAMTLRLYAGADPPPLFGAPNQRVENEAFSLRTVELEAGPGAEVEAWELEYALAHDDDDIDHANPEIRRLSATINRGAQSDRDKVRKMVRWVYRNMRYQKADTPRASDVSKTLVGDCTEYTHLFMALSRAAGIPTRRVVGLAYTEYRGEPAFGYHAWAEVAIDGRWLPVDPTWNEPVADATHIKLSEGFARSWDRVLDDLEIEVLSVIRRHG